MIYYEELEKQNKMKHQISTRELWLQRLLGGSEDRKR